MQPKDINKSKKQPKKETQTHNNLHHLARTYVQDNDKKPKQQLYQTEFQFDCKSVLHLWLTEILPGPKYKGLTYDFENKKIKGDGRECRRKIQQCEKFLKQHKMKLYESKQLELNEQLYLQKSMQIKIFRKQIIQRASQDLIQNYGLRELKRVISPILQKKYVCMMSILIAEQDFFLKIIQKIKKLEGITRSDIKQAQQQRQKKEAALKKKIYIQKQTDKSLRKQESFDVSINFSNQDHGSDDSEQKKQKSQDDYSDESQQFLRFDKKGKKILPSSHTKQNKCKGQERGQIVKQQVYKQEVERKKFNIDLFRDWVKKNTKIEDTELDIKQQANSYQITVFSSQNNSIKIKQLNSYFKFDQLIIFQGKAMEIFQYIKQFLEEINQDYIQFQCLYVFVKPQAKQKQIEDLFREKKLVNQKSKKNSRKVNLISLLGIKPNVQEIYNKIMDRQKQLLKYNSIITQIFNLSVKELEQYVDDKRVQNLVIKITTEIVQKNKLIKLIDISISGQKIALNLQMHEKMRDQFIKKWQVQIEKQLSQRIIIQDIIQKQQVTKQLQQKYILLKNKNNGNRIVLIEQKQKLMQSTKDILTRQQKFQKKEIVIKKNRLPHLKSFIANLQVTQGKIMNNVQVNYKNQDNTTKVQIYAAKYCQKIYNIITQEVQRLDAQILQKTIIVSDFQASIIDKNEAILQKKVQQLHGLSFVLSRQIKIQALITLGRSREPKVDDPTVIYIYKQKCLSFLPKNTTFIFLSQYDIRYLHESTFEDAVQFFKVKKGANNNVYYMKDEQHKFIYTYYPKCSTVQDGIKKTIQQSRLKNKQASQKGKYQNFALFMPKDKKIQFVISVINTFYQNYANQKNKIFIFEHALENLNDFTQSLQDIYKFYSKTTQIRYFIQEGLQQFYFSHSGDKKIEQALSRGEQKVILSNNDLNLKQDTHLCSFKEQKLIHIKSKIVTNLSLFPDRVTFKLNGVEFEMPIQQVKKVQKNKSQWVPISIGAYQIDLKSNIQKNLFTGFTRLINKKQTKIVNPYGKLFLNIDFEYKINEIEVCYKPNQEEHAHKTCKLLKQLIQKQKIVKQYPLNKQFTEQKFQELGQNLKGFNMEISWGQKSIMIEASDKHIIDFAIKKIQIMSLDFKIEITYPDYWSPQAKQVQVFIVPPQSKQFKDIQTQFAISPIKELLRIQNKLVYQNYKRQEELLMRLNQGKAVRQMMLYHGTKNTDPKIIYEDKQECFNVNFTGQNNYLGKAIYFAEKAAYSRSYEHRYVENNELVNCMFYCNVLVGDSQIFDKECQQTKKLKNTNFKDQTNKIRYQSTCLNTTRGKIYAVYKNRRAYPQYLIKY